MKALPFLLLVLILAGCEEAKERTRWYIRYVPTTDAERKAVAEQVDRIMTASHASTLAGHDQDLDDAIKEATTSACRTLCRPTMWQRGDYGRETGRWRYVDGPEGKADK